MTVELPMDALDWQNADSLKGLMYLSPGFNDGAYDEDLLVAAEVRYRLADGTEDVSSNNHGPDRFVEVRVSGLVGTYYGNPPSTLSISIQAVDETAVFQGLPTGR